MNPRPFPWGTSLAQSAAVKDARTDVNGRYEFKGVPRGKYYVTANPRMFAADLFWLVQVEVRGRQSVDLSSSNRSSPFDLIRGDAEMAKTLAAPVSAPAPPETPHQPKWPAEELAKENQAVEERREAKGTWQPLQTVFRRRASAGEKFEDILKEILENPDRFQSQAVVASSLSKDECRTVANRVSNAARTSRDRRYDHQEGVALIRSDREAADTSGWTTRPRIEESITVQVWACGNTAQDARSRLAQSSVQASSKPPGNQTGRIGTSDDRSRLKILRLRPGREPQRAESDEDTED